MEIEFSEREKEILKLVSTGASNKEIAQVLDISPNTVKVHLRNIFAKANLYSRTEATLFAIKMGLVESPGNTPVQALGEAITEDAVPVSNNRIWYLLGVGLLVILAFVAVGALNNWWRPTPAPMQSPERWTDLPPLPEPLVGFSAQYFDNKIYVLSGQSINGVTGSVNVYDLREKDWSAAQELPIPVRDSVSVTLGEQILLIGGLDASGKPVSEIQVFEPLQNRISLAYKLPFRVANACAVVFQGQIYLFGGEVDGVISDSILKIDPESFGSDQVTKLPLALRSLGCVAVDNRIHIFGGKSPNGDSAEHWAFYPSRIGGDGEVWEKLAPLEKPISNFAFSGLAGNVYYFAPDADGKQNYRYDALTNQWTQIEPSPAPVDEGTLAVSEGTNIHLLGGAATNGLTNDHISYQAIYIVLVPAVSNQ
ncbi:MAG TPA: LuxR C-terminal-related transcriptional regulator [Bellilinea sp.]|nr:LuxR C-terminal-related transcriptional regulator [Bellilinea sp.]